MGCAEGRSPIAGSLRVSLRYDIFPLPTQEGSQGVGRMGFFNTLVTTSEKPDARLGWHRA